MPYERHGKTVRKKSTGKVVGKSKTVEKAKSHERVLNAAHAAKKRGKKLTVVPGKGFRFDGAKTLNPKKKNRRS